MQEWEKGYLAGFIDADGSISIHKQNRTNNHHRQIYYYRLIMCVANRHLGILQWMQKVTGELGSLTKRNLNRSNPNWSDAWQLRWNSNAMFNILKTIRPFMLMKGSHADLALEMIELKRGTLSLMQVKQRQQTKLMQKDYIQKLDRYEDIYKALKILNKTGQEYIDNNRVNSGELHGLVDNPELSLDGQRCPEKCNDQIVSPNNNLSKSARRESEEMI